MVIGRRVWLVENADARLDEQAGLGLEVQRREFLDWSADGAVGTGDDIIPDICVIQNFRGGSFKPGAVKILAVQGQAGDHAGLVEACAVIETTRRIDLRHFGGDLAVGNRNDRRAGEQGAHRFAASRRRLRRLGPRKLGQQGGRGGHPNKSYDVFHYLASSGP